MSNRSWMRLSCDTLVAMAPATRAGLTLFAKNSDRPSLEPQPLRQFPAREHAAGATVATQYLELPQVALTAAMIGSQPHWLWGFEHGVNEHRVAIGNETVFTKEYPGESGLLGMDLVRLGLERAKNAAEALEIITSLIEEYGQGGSAYCEMDWRYNNSFLIADPNEAWILETSDRRWAARRAGQVDSISNHVSITDDWDASSADMQSYADEQGWNGGAGRFSFQAAYRDTSLVPTFISEGRLCRSREMLAASASDVTPAKMRMMLRDHYDGGLVFRGGEPDQENYYSICMHADPVGTTTASIIAQLPVDDALIPVCWTAMATPCTGVFLPIFIDGTIPEGLGVAGPQPGDDSPWWRMKAVEQACSSDFCALTPIVQEIFHGWEEHIDAEVVRVCDRAARLRKAGDEAGVHDLLTAFMKQSYDHAASLCEQARASVASSSSASPLENSSGDN